MPTDTWATRKRAEAQAMKWADEAVGNTAAPKAALDEGAQRMAQDAAIGHTERQRGLSAYGFSDAEQRKLKRQAGGE